MNDKYIKLAVQEFSKSGSASYEKTFKIKDSKGVFYTVTIVKETPKLITESIGFESRSNTISALPSGSTCGCCNGSGRSI
ncbi:hypothetical protein [Aeromonas veronii]|uniref:hypothetical protein n=1 Tax=Aeromonas veronii TaxID=654 RepID=UPI003B9F247C